MSGAYFWAMKPRRTLRVRVISWSSGVQLLVQEQEAPDLGAAQRSSSSSRLRLTRTTSWRIRS